MKDIHIQTVTWYGTLCLARDYEANGWELCFEDRNGTVVLQKGEERVYIKPAEGATPYILSNGTKPVSFLTFCRRNKKGEGIQVEFSRSEGNLAEKWYKAGSKDRILKSWWSIKTYVTLPDGRVIQKYNPTMTSDKRLLHFDFVLDATPENLEYILAKIEEMAFHSI